MNPKARAAAVLVVAGTILPIPTLGFTTFHQCASQATGDLRAVSPDAECRPNEDRLYLNIPEVVHGSVIDGNAYTNGARGFTYSRPRAGQYVITFSAPLSSAPDCVADIINPPAGVVAYCDTVNTILSADGVAISCWSFAPTVNTWSLVDQDFTFTCVH